LKPLILITNDDGIHSPGIRAAAKAAFDFGELLIAAPITQQSSMGRSFPYTEEAGIIEKMELILDNERSVAGYGVYGTPASAAAHAVLELADRKPDLCISGINYGGNLGLSITGSGTLGAAWEASSHGIPSLAVSLEVEEEIIYSRAYADVDFRSAEEITRYWIEWALCKGMPSDCDILNINVPSGRTGVLDYRFTRLERSNYYQLLKPGKRDFAKPFRFQSETLKKPESDRANGDIFTVLRDRLTSVTPLSWDMSMDI